MKVLIGSPAFLPQIGGLQNVVAQLAAGLARRGVDCVVVTTAPAQGEERSFYRVVRRPGPFELLRWVRWCDVFLQANISLRQLWPLALVPRPWVAWHHGGYRRSDGRVLLRDRLKRFLGRYATSVSVSAAVAVEVGYPSVVIPNAYRDDVFRVLPGALRNRDLVFVGRLVSEKGVDGLLAALVLLSAEGLRPKLAVIGDGPEAPSLREQTRRLGLEAQVEFLGSRTGDELVELLNRHRILVVPTLSPESFGIVALEGIACGCAVVGSVGGGLEDTIGPCGVTFPNGDAAALAQALASLLLHPERLAGFHEPAADHLERYTGDVMVEAHLALLRSATASRAGRLA